jgi:6,7-dimethyl-8-ribityllumazine synthase
MTEQFRPKEIRGVHNAAGLRVGVVVSRFNSFITARLLSGALEALEQGGASADQTDVVHVPGSFEIPVIAKKMALGRGYDAIIAIGCILRGETAHFAQMDTGVPIIFCVLTCDTLEQAIDRAGLKGGNKGYEAGLAALEMARLSLLLAPRAGGAADEQDLPARAAAQPQPAKRR